MENAGSVMKTADTSEARREAARLLGSIMTERKRAANRAHGFKKGVCPPGAGRKAVPLFEIPCRCGAGEVVEGHKAACPRGAAVKRRAAQGKDLMTGAPLAEAQP